MITQERPWALMSTDEYDAMAQWVVWAPWCHAHECSLMLMTAVDAMATCSWVSWLLMSAHQCSRVAIGAMVPCSWVFICIHEHVHGANSTHEHGPMVPTTLVSLNEQTTMTLIPLIAPWQHKGCTKKNALKLAQQFLLNFSSYKHDRQLGHNSFEKWDP